jgi:4-hydroxy-tetrahydrodipicolinate synthase
MNGLAERFAPAFALEGAEAFSTGIGNFAPRAVRTLADALDAEDWTRARTIAGLFREYENLRDEPGSNNRFGAANNVPAIKYGMSLAGYYGGPVRDPLVELSAEDQSRAEEYYQHIQRIDEF